VPPNCRFEIDDAEDEWIHSEPFDYIHARAVLSCFKDPRFILQQAYNSLSPGGYLEMQDFIVPFGFLGEQPVESPLYKWFQIITEGAAKLGRPWTNVKYYKKWMEEVGFEDVVEKKYYWPINPWAKSKGNGVNGVVC
jgi:trans-aconitate methyltransferase